MLTSEPSNAIVARGLVHRVCLHGLVSQRRSKLNYGVVTHQPYEKDVHMGQGQKRGQSLTSWTAMNMSKPSNGFFPRWISVLTYSLHHYSNSAQDQAIIEGKEIVKDRFQYFRLRDRRLFKDEIVWHEEVDTSAGPTMWRSHPKDLTGSTPKSLFTSSNHC